MAKAKFQDPNARHVRIYCSLLGTHAYRVLGYAAKALFIDMLAMTTRGEGQVCHPDTA